MTAEEVCLWESFNVSCDAGEVVFIEKALFGSTHDNRCFNLTENDTSCSADIRFEIQNQIGLNQSIQLKLASDFFTTKTPTCLNGRMPFLEIVYQCAKSKIGIHSRTFITVNIIARTIVYNVARVLICAIQLHYHQH